jgi:hypothetical protein
MASPHQALPGDPCGICQLIGKRRCCYG